MRTGLLVAILAMLFFSGCASQSSLPTIQNNSPVPTTTVSIAQEKTTNPLVGELPIFTRPFQMGVAGFVPASYPNSSSADWQNLFDSLPEYGEWFGVYSAWNDQPKENIPEQIHTAFGLQKKYGIIPLIAIGIEPDSLTQTEADSYFETNQNAFIETARAIAKTYQPKYLALGVEINRLYEKSPKGFDAFVETYKEAYDAIKKESPSTKVFPIFQFDYMRGKAKRSGKEHISYFDLREKFSGKMDAIGYTVYPFLEYDSVSQIPNDYFSEMKMENNLPILITETGWPSEPVAEINGSEDAQKEYLVWLLNQTKSLPLEGLIWVFPHSAAMPVGEGLFDSLSMKQNDGTPKKVWEYWKALREI